MQDSFISTSIAPELIDWSNEESWVFHCVKSAQIRSYLWSVFSYIWAVSSPNTEKYGPEITPYLDTFHAVFLYWKLQETFNLYCVFKIQFRLKGYLSLFQKARCCVTFCLETRIINRASSRRSLMWKRDRVDPKVEPRGARSEDEFLFKWIRSLLPLRNYKIW